MIKTHSNDPDVEHAASEALAIIQDTLGKLAKAEMFDYGGHQLKIGEYGVCERCTTPIAEAQQAKQALEARAAQVKNDTVKEHLDLAAKLFELEAEAAIVRAELHNGHGTESILNKLLAFQYERHVGDEYQHSHHGGKA
jgi:hypothetical protein